MCAIFQTAGYTFAGNKFSGKTAYNAAAPPSRRHNFSGGGIEGLDRMRHR